MEVEGARKSSVTHTHSEAKSLARLTREISQRGELTFTAVRGFPRSPQTVVSLVLKRVGPLKDRRKVF